LLGMTASDPKRTFAKGLDTSHRVAVGVIAARVLAQLHGLANAGKYNGLAAASA